MTAPTKEQRVCCYCPQTKDLRPYGPKGAWVCFPCATATPEREAEAHRQLGALFDACDRQGPISVLTEAGPRPLEKGNG